MKYLYNGIEGNTEFAFQGIVPSLYKDGMGYTIHLRKGDVLEFETLKFTAPSSGTWKFDVYRKPCPGGDCIEIPDAITWSAQTIRYG